MDVQRGERARRIIFAMLVALLLAASGSSGLRGSDLFDELYRRGQKQNGELRTLSATFTETTTSSLLIKPLTASGIVAVERPYRVALRYSKPEERIILIDGDRMTVSWPSRGIRQARDIGASQRRIQKYFVNGSPDELRSQFQIAAQGANDAAGAYLITMVPRRKQIQEGLSRLELWVDPTTLLLRMMRMRFPNGDEKVMAFSDVKTNVPIDPSIFNSGLAEPPQLASMAAPAGPADFTSPPSSNSRR